MSILDDYFRNTNNRKGELGQGDINSGDFGSGKIDSGFGGKNQNQNNATNFMLNGSQDNYGSTNNVTTPKSFDMFSFMGNSGNGQQATESVPKQGLGANAGNMMKGGGAQQLSSTGDAMFQSYAAKKEEEWFPKADEHNIIRDDDRTFFQKGGAMGYAKGSSTGAAMGTQIMPGWGTLVGAIVGGIGGTIMGHNQLKKDKQMIEKHNYDVGVGVAQGYESQMSVNDSKRVGTLESSLNNLSNLTTQSQQTDFYGNSNQKKNSIENGVMYTDNGRGKVPLIV